MSLLTASILACVNGVVASGAVGGNCGQVYPSGFLKHGSTVQRTLMYGAPTGMMTEYEPFLAGCAPATGYYSEGQKIAQVDMTYAKESLSVVPLVQTAVSNDTDVASFYISYESTEPGSFLPLRPRNVTVVLSGGGVNLGNFSYDARGRLILVNWTYTGNASLRLAPGAEARSPVERLRSGLPTSPTEGYETFEYTDQRNPELVTVYRSDGVPTSADGPESHRYKWTTNADGFVTDTTSLEFEQSECPAWPCKSGTSCCRPIGSNASVPGTCYKVDSCDALGGGIWHYDYDKDGRTLSMNASGVLQEYEYDDAQRVVGFHQGNKTFFMAGYDNGTIHDMTYFVIYPVFPEIWAFGPPVQVEIPEVLVV